MARHTTGATTTSAEPVCAASSSPTVPPPEGRSARRDAARARTATPTRPANR
jgi:hypothetical protein